MKVILLQDVKGVGKKDQVIEAADGYVRNFLFPKKLAVEANKANMNSLDKKKAGAEAQRIKDLEDARAMKAAIESKVLKISQKTGEGGRLFGSVTNKEVAQILMEQEGIEIDRKKITIPEAIKKTGEYTAEIKLHTDVSAGLKLEITSL
ncbi:MAG: 50S ribosomal protein L9 [Defluviitaleaceae bacterium]|nr:50S ribosomal protein L9 [Defluviitaleaceae bacterium]